MVTLLAPGITINVAGQSILSGIYRGPDAAVELCQRVIDLMGAGFKFPLHDVLANDDWIVVLPSSAGWRTAALGMDLYRIDQGRIAEIWITEWHTDRRNDGPG